MRKLIWSKEKHFEGCACSDCGWLSPNPTLDFQKRTEKELIEKIEADFGAHDCKRYPKTPTSPFGA
jgi:hypothetical protein